MFGRNLLIRKAWRVRQFAVDLLLFWMYRLRGKSYVEFYARKMDRIAKYHPERATGDPATRRFQLDYLVASGLQRDTRFLDYGCGTVAAGVHFIDYLQPNCYVGADISAQCLEVGNRRLRDAGLIGKGPRLVYLPGGSLAPLEGLKFDLIWAQSVLTHMAPSDIEGLLHDIRPFIASGGAFYATFAHDSSGPLQRRVKDWYYPDTFFQAVAHRTAYQLDQMTDWHHPDGDRDRLIRFRPLGTAGSRY